MTEFWHSALAPHLESRRSCQEAACYRPHTYDRFSVGLIDSGTTVCTGAAGTPVPLAAGDVILIPAGHVHACNPERGRWRYQMIQAEQDWITARSMLRDGRTLADTAHALGFADQSHFHRVFRAHVAASPGAYRG